MDTVNAKDLRQKDAWHVLGTAQKLAWLKHSTQESMAREVREGKGVKS